MWKTTPTASLQVILNQKPSHIEVKGACIRSYMCIKNLFQNNFWDGIPNNRRANSHLATLKFNTHDIIHEGIPLDNFKNDFLKEPSFIWNPPICNTLTAVCKNNIDNQLDFSDFEAQSQNDNDDSSSGETDSLSGDITMTPVKEFLQDDGVCPRHGADVATSGNVSINPGEEFLLVNVDRPQHDIDHNITVKPVEEFLQVDRDHTTMTPVEEFLRVDGNLHTSEIPKGISKIS